MRVTFVPRENGPERLVTEAELVFDEGPVSGLKLVGFCLWKAMDGEVYVTFPSRAIGTGSERRFFDFLRSANGSADAVRAFKKFVLDEFKKATE